MADTSTHEMQAEEEAKTRGMAGPVPADTAVGPLDRLASRIEEVVLDSVGSDLTETGKVELPFESEQLAVRLLRAVERNQGAEVLGVEEHVRSLLRVVGGPMRAKRIAERIGDKLDGIDIGRL